MSTEPRFTDEQIRAAYAAISDPVGAYETLGFQAVMIAACRRILEAPSDFDARTIACALGWGNPAAADYLRRAAGVPTCAEPPEPRYRVVRKLHGAWIERDGTKFPATVEDMELIARLLNEYDRSQP